MTKQYKATPEQWETIEKYADSIAYNCILELRARIEALESTQHPNSSASLRSSPAGSLVERVGNQMPLLPNGCVDDASARAAILEVAAWLRLEISDWYGADRLEQEANR